jgi:septum formation topological specificity factor MinE
VGLLLLGRLKWHGKILAKRRERNSSHPNHRKMLKNDFLKIVLKYKKLFYRKVDLSLGRFLTVYEF